MGFRGLSGASGCAAGSCPQKCGEEAAPGPTQLLLASPSCQPSSETAVFSRAPAWGLELTLLCGLPAGNSPRVSYALSDPPGLGLAPTTQHRISAG